MVTNAESPAAVTPGVGPTYVSGTFVGSPVRRLEDPRLLRGGAGFIANMRIDGVAELAFVRSPVAHALILSIDATEAMRMRGVIGVFTSENLELPFHTGPVVFHPACVRPPLARGKVRFVGDVVAVVAAERLAQAIDAAETIVVDYQPLPAVVDPEAALAPAAPVLFEEIGTNLVAGTRDPGDALADADVVVRGRFENQRVAVVPMEGNAIAVLPADDGAGHSLTMYLGTQFPHRSRGEAAQAFGVEPDSMRVIAPDIGGGFGGKQWAAEHVVAVGAARALGRPVRWVEARSENMVSMPHGRSSVQYVEMGFARDGGITGMRCRLVGDAGAYGGYGGALPMGTTRTVGQGVYFIPQIVWDAAVVVTNTTSTGPYRGAGRPEAAALLERIMDMAADELGIDPAELRRRNFLRPEDFPYTTLTGAPYDSGNYEAALDEALRIAGYEALRADQADRRRNGDVRQLGIGIACYVEASAPAFGELGQEFGAVEVHTDGTATIRAGTSAHGQGHATTFAMIVADRLGIPIESTRFVQSDTALVPSGGGTAGSRSGQMGGSAVLEAADLVVTRARELAADLLEAAPEDIVVLGDGKVGVTGVPAKALSWAELATTAEERGEPLEVEHIFVQGKPTFPFGAHVSVVEVDTETGIVDVVNHVAVDDCGRVINPMIVEGQVHGGVASGIGQALFEHFRYDDDGNPLTPTLLDYKMPSAAELPSFETGHTETLSPHNPLGAKGVGESGTTGATPAVQNAVVDALSHFGVRHIDMPCTPERVWRLIQDARAGKLASPWQEPPEALATVEMRDGPPRRAPVEQVRAKRAAHGSVQGTQRQASQ
jgi:carbon-monoxide dehydrogenase large subunit